MASNQRQARTQVGGRQTFVQYVCCPKCRSIYPKEQCVLKDWKVLLVLMLDFLHTHNIVNDYLVVHR